MILEITKLGEEILRQKAEPVAEVNDEIRTLANDMLETMIEADGVGLAGPQVYESITRPVGVTVQALNEKGKPYTLEADGLLARIIQHEYDHLDGILYIDRGDKAFAEKTEAQFKKRAERAAEKAREKEAKARKIAAKIAAKEAKKAKQDGIE